MSATAVPASACLSATPICSSVNPFLGILRASFQGASLPEKLHSPWIRIWGQDHYPRCWIVTAALICATVVTEYSRLLLESMRVRPDIMRELDVQIAER